MATLSSLSKLTKIKMPNGNTYAFIDLDGRAMIAADYEKSHAYKVGDYFIYNDNLCKTTGDFTSATNAPTSGKYELVTVGSELKAIKDNLSTGIHYKGYTTTALSDGATTNPIIIDSKSYTAVSGDLVIYNNGTKELEFIYSGSKWNEFGSTGTLKALAFKDEASGTYKKATGGSVTIPTVSKQGKKLTTGTHPGIASTAKTASKATAGDSVEVAKAGTAVVYGKADVGTALSVGTSLSGTVTFNTDAIKDASITTGNATGTQVVTSAIKSAELTGTKTFNTNAISAAELVSTTTGGIAIPTNAIKSASLTGTKTFVTSAIKSAELTGTKTFNTDAISAAELTGTTTFVTSAIKSAELTGTKTFNTNAISSASLTGTTTFVTEAYIPSVDASDTTCLVFTAAGTASVGISTIAAGTASVGISTVAAGTGSVGISTTAAGTASVGISTTAAGTGSVDISTATADAVSYKISTTAAGTASVGISTATADTTKLGISTVAAGTGTVSLTTSSITPAVAAPSTQKIVPAVSNGSIATYSFADVTDLAAVSGTVTYATGAVENATDGATFYSVDTGTTTATVTISNTDETVTVK